MTSVAIMEVLHELQREHYNDGDGGYILVASIRQWIGRQSPEERVEIYEVLLAVVQDTRPSLRGVALEVLTQQRSRHAASRLLSMVLQSKASQEWDDQVVLALIRMRYREGADFYLRYISEGLAEQVGDKRVGIVMMLAAFCRINREACIDLASLYYGTHLTSEKAVAEYSWAIPAFTRCFADVDKQLFAEIIRETRKVNAEAAVRLKNLFDEHLKKAFVIREFGLTWIMHVRNLLYTA